MAQDKIMVVDNEIEIVQLLRLYLTREGYQVIWTTDSTKALSLAREEKPDLILLDIVMPGLSGMDLCSQLREHFDVPILFISCKKEDMDKILGLSIGGDDYITKPFSPAEVVARIKAHLRRQKRDNADNVNYKPQNNIIFGDITIDLNGHTVTAGTEPVHLTAKEFDLLVLLAKYPNRVFTVKQIFDNIWDSYGEGDDYRTVMVHISNIRKKIEADIEHSEYIQTVRGVGYKLNIK